MCFDFQRGAQIRLELLLIFVVIWILLLPIGYLLLVKAANADWDGGAGCLGGLFDIPHERSAARAKLTMINIILIVTGVAMLGLCAYLAIPH
jgi:hypothetical protein